MPFYGGYMGDDEDEGEGGFIPSPKELRIYADNAQFFMDKSRFYGGIQIASQIHGSILKGKGMSMELAKFLGHISYSYVENPEKVPPLADMGMPNLRKLAIALGGEDGESEGQTRITQLIANCYFTAERGVAILGLIEAMIEKEMITSPDDIENVLPSLDMDLKLAAACWRTLMKEDLSEAAQWKLEARNTRLVKLIEGEVQPNESELEDLDRLMSALKNAGHLADGLTFHDLRGDTLQAVLMTYQRAEIHFLLGQFSAEMDMIDKQGEVLLETAPEALVTLLAERNPMAVTFRKGNLN